MQHAYETVATVDGVEVQAQRKAPPPVMPRLPARVVARRLDESTLRVAADLCTVDAAYEVLP